MRDRLLGLSLLLALAGCSGEASGPSGPSLGVVGGLDGSGSSGQVGDVGSGNGLDPGESATCRISVTPPAPCLVPRCTPGGLLIFEAAELGVDCYPEDCCAAEGVCEACAPGSEGCVEQGVRCVPVRMRACGEGGACFEVRSVCEVGVCRCLRLHAPDGTPCDSGLPGCTAGDHCAAGECVSGPGAPLDDQNPCTVGRCAGGEVLFEPVEGPCEDGDPCTLGDRCVEDRCEPEGVVECPLRGCMSHAFCDADTGECAYLSELDGTPCAPKSPCATRASCQSGVCVDGRERDCDDGNECTDDGCDPASGVCVHGKTEAGTPCEAGDPCVVEATCYGGACFAQAFRHCDDGDDCTDDFCDRGDGSCRHEITAACCQCQLDEHCWDANPCTVDSCTDCLCANERVEQPCCWKEEECDDGDPCTADTCAETLCVHTEIEGCCRGDVDCDDGYFCSGTELCDPETHRCLSGEEPCHDTHCYEDGHECVECLTDEHCADEIFCNGAERCLLHACSDPTEPACAPGDPCDEVDRACVLPGSPRLEVRLLRAGAEPVEVPLVHTYRSPVVVCMPYPEANSAPVVVRVSELGSYSFALRLQTPSAGEVVEDAVGCLVVDEGAWEIEGWKIEARRYLSSRADNWRSWVGEQQQLQHTFTSPVVLGQVMSEHDERWSVFWARGAGTEVNPPQAGHISTGHHVGEDPDPGRSSELIGYVVFEAAHVASPGVEAEARLGEDTIQGANGVWDAYPYNLAEPFGSPPAVVIASIAGMDGYNGGWPVMPAARSPSETRIYLTIDEDLLGDDERVHTTEHVGYAAFSGPFAFPPRPVPEAGVE